jgi:hypothetical protein
MDNMTNELDYSKIDNIEFDGIDYDDYPDFCDTYISNADYDGVEMTEEQLELINDDRDFIYEALMKHLY